MTKSSFVTKMVEKSLIEIAKRQKLRFPIGTKLKTSTITSLWTENYLNQSLPRWRQDFRVMPYFGELVLQNLPENSSKIETLSWVKFFALLYSLKTYILLSGDKLWKPLTSTIIIHVKQFKNLYLQYRFVSKVQKLSIMCLAIFYRFLRDLWGYL